MPSRNKRTSLNGSSQFCRSSRISAARLGPIPYEFKQPCGQAQTFDLHVEVVIHGRKETTIHIKKQKNKYELKYLELQELLPGHSPSYKISK